jgi:hypothetical protein
VAIKPVDFRKGHDGLAAVVQSELGLDPHSGIIVVFRSKRAVFLNMVDYMVQHSGPLSIQVTPKRQTAA